MLEIYIKWTVEWKFCWMDDGTLLEKSSSQSSTHHYHWLLDQKNSLSIIPNNTKKSFIIFLIFRVLSTLHDHQYSLWKKYERENFSPFISQACFSSKYNRYFLTPPHEKISCISLHYILHRTSYCIILLSQ